MVLHESIRIVGRVGDRDPLNDGGAILDHGDKRPTLVYLVSFEDAPVNRQCETCGIGEECNLSFEKYGADLLDIEDAAFGPHAWIRPEDVARSCGYDVDDYRAMAFGDLRQKAIAVIDAAGYYGWMNFDSYPDQMSHDEAEEWSAALDEAEKRPGRGELAKMEGR